MWPNLWPFSYIIICVVSQQDPLEKTKSCPLLHLKEVSHQHKKCLCIQSLSSLTTPTYSTAVGGGGAAILDQNVRQNWRDSPNILSGNSDFRDIPIEFSDGDLQKKKKEQKNNQKCNFMHTRFCVCELTPVHLDSSPCAVLLPSLQFMWLPLCIIPTILLFGSAGGFKLQPLLRSTLSYCGVCSVSAPQYGQGVTHIEMHRGKQDLQIIPHNNSFFHSPHRPVFSHKHTFPQCPSVLQTASL